MCFNEAIKTERKNGIKVSVFLDDCLDNPIETLDNLGTMVCFHNKYSLGDTHGYKEGDYNSWDELKKAILKTEKPLVILPLYLYDHSGITISTKPFGCRWDSGQVGFIFTTKQKMTEFSLLGYTKKEIADDLKYEVERYDKYLTGEGYGYKVFDQNDEEIDAGWGYDDIDEALSEGLASI